MTSSGKYKVSTANLYNRHQDEYNYSTPRRPHRSNNSRHKSYRGEDATDGEDEKRLLSLSERIKKLSTSRVLKDNSVLTHNNNEPFTYLRGPNNSPQRKSANTSSVNIGSSYHTNGVNVKSNVPKGREVIYAQVVVDPEDRKNNPYNSHGKNKRTVHRSYNNSNYTSPYAQTFNTKLESGNNNAQSASKMKGRNVTTVLLNSSSDDIPSSLNIEERIGFNDSRYRSSSSPLLASNDDYYPKSPGIVKQMQNGYGGTRSRYENHYQRHSTDYLHRQSDDDDGYNNDYKYGGNKYSNPRGKQRDKSPFGYGERDTDNSDDFYSYQPVNYGGKSASTNFIDSYGYNKSRENYRIEEEDEYDVTRNLKFEGKKSKTLERDTSFKNHSNRAEDFINRSKTLDNRISSLREKAMMLEEQKRRERGGDPYDDFKLTTSLENKSELDTNFLSKRNNTQSKNMANTTKTKDKSSGSSNIFSTLLRRNNKKVAEQKSLPQSKSTSALNSFSASTPKTKTDGKKNGQSSNFFTSFLEKKRKKQQLTDLPKGQTQKGDSHTYQSFNNWPSDPPSFSVIDYSAPSPVSKPYYGENNIDTEDSTAHGSDIWKKSYGNDMTKVKRRWTMREPTKPNVIREEEDMTTRTLGRKPVYTSSVAINSNSIDRRRANNYSAERQENYDPIKKRYYDESDSFLKVPDASTSGGKYNTVDTRYSRSPEKIRYSPQKYDEYDGIKNNNNSSNTLTRRGRNLSADKFTKGYGGGGLVGTPNSSGSESNNNRMVNGSMRSVYLHEPAVISEMPRTTISLGGGGGASLSELRRTLSKDEISNYSGPRKETKQLSRSMSMAHPWGPNKTYREKYSEIDYSRNNNLPPRPPSRSPSGTLGLGLNSRQSGSSIKSGRSPSKSFNSGTKARPKPPPVPPVPRGRKPVSSSVESLLRQDTPEEVLQNKGGSKLGRSKSMSVSQNMPRDGKNNRFSTLWFNKKNSNK